MTFFCLMTLFTLLPGAMGDVSFSSGRYYLGVGDIRFIFKQEIV